MICLKKVKMFCKGDYTKIENYDKAIADSTQTWHCHHKDEVKILPSGIQVIRSKDELIENGRYYDCPPNELIFMTRSDHRKLHTIGIPVSRSLKAKNNLSDGRVSDLGKRFKAVYGLRPRECRLAYKKEKGVFARFGKLSVELTEQEINDCVKNMKSINASRFLNKLAEIKEALNEYNIRW